MKKYGIAVALLLAVLIVPSALAQEDLDEVFVADDGTFMFYYPSTWDLEIDDEAGAVIVYNADMALFIYGPATVESWDWDMSDPVEIMQALADQWAEDGLDVSNVQEMELAGRAAAYVNYDNGGTPGLMAFVVFSDGSLGAIDVIGNDGEKDIADRDTVLAIAETFDVPSGGVSGGVSLSSYDEDYQDVIAELRDLDLIGSGGTLLFEEDYAWFEGQGSFYTPLARNSPARNFVMSGELTYRPSGSTNNEECTLGMRVVWSGSTTNEYTDVGYSNQGFIYYLDITGGSEDFSDGIEVDEDVLTDPHIFTIIAIDDELTVFVDGELILDGGEIESRSGTWGIGLNGAGAGAKCEGRNIWVYTLP
jgi:hypothetical protein